MKVCKQMATLMVIGLVLTFITALVAGYTLYYEVREMILK